MSQHSSAIRKAAILVSALDDRAADALLEEMGAEMAARVRNAIMELSEVPPDEQQQVVAEFLHGRAPASMGSTASPAPSSDTGVEIDESLARILENPSDIASSPANRTVKTHAAEEQPLDFLRHVPAKAILRSLQGERAQTISAIVARLDADQAAFILERLPAEQATDVLERMAWNDSLSSETLAEVARQLRRELAPYLHPPSEQASALTNLHAILGAMNPQARERVIGSLATQNTPLVRQLGYDRLTSTTNLPDTYSVSSFRYRIQRADEVMQAAYRQTRNDSNHGESAVLLEFDDFLSLSDEALKRIFAAAEAPLVLLALAGADERLIARILRQLPPREAVTFRKRLNHPGAIRLRDIEQAQEQLATLARHLCEQGLILIPHSRHFAAAA